MEVGGNAHLLQRYHEVCADVVLHGPGIGRRRCPGSDPAFNGFLAHFHYPKPGFLLDLAGVLLLSDAHSRIADAGEVGFRRNKKLHMRPDVGVMDRKIDNLPL